MEPELQSLIQAMHDAPQRIVLVIAGAGSQALAWLLQVPGASRTLIEARVLYESRAFAAFLQQTPKQYVAAKTGRMLAGRALTQAQLFRDEQEPVVGVACTATLVTDRPKRGAHRVHIATWQPAGLVTYYLELEKGSRSRVEEEALVSRLLLNAVAGGMGIDRRLSLPLRSAEQVECETIDFTQPTQRLFRKEIPFFGVYADGRVRTTGIHPQTLLPGAFNPLHQGHLSLARHAAEFLGRPVAFELSAVNVDKPAMEPSTVRERIAQFAGRWPIYVSNAPTFLEKARLFPGVTFVTGYDTARRILHPRYYQHSTTQMVAALAEMKELGCRFLVAGRVDTGDVYQTITDLALPAGFADLFVPLPNFRQDISSTMLRAAGKRGSR